jgi:hypothetical protein
MLEFGNARQKINVQQISTGVVVLLQICRHTAGTIGDVC